MTNENTGENQTNQSTGENQQKNQENQGQQLNRIRQERNELKKKSQTLEAQKGHWKEKAETLLNKGSKEEPETEEKPNKPSEPDYYKNLTLKTYLKGEGVSEKEDQDWLLKESDNLQKPVEELLSIPYYQAELKKRGEQRTAEASMPEGKGQPTGGNKGSVDYWVDRKNKDGSYATPSDPELHQKVINERLKREEKASKFDPIR